MKEKKTYYFPIFVKGTIFRNELNKKDTERLKKIMRIINKLELEANKIINKNKEGIKNPKNK